MTYLDTIGIDYDSLPDFNCWCCDGYYHRSLVYVRFDRSNLNQK